MTVEIGSPAPDFTLPASGGGTVTLSALKGRKVIVYFYPKDATPGCTKEACDFRDAHPEFGAIDAAVIGISKDSQASHDKFVAARSLPFALASDVEGKAVADYGVWVEKKNYGKTYMGIERSTFLIDAEGIVRNVWRGVRVPGHVDAVLKAARAI